MDGASQHPQGLDFAGAIIFSQSLMSAASLSWPGAMTCAGCACRLAICMAAHAEMSGVNVRDAAIKIARMTRKRRREEVLPETGRGCTSYMNILCRAE